MNALKLVIFYSLEFMFPLNFIVYGMIAFFTLEI